MLFFVLLGLALFAAYVDFILIGIRNWKTVQRSFWIIVFLMALQLSYAMQYDPKGLGGNFVLFMLVTGPAFFIFGCLDVLKALAHIRIGPEAARSNNQNNGLR
jgi:hypothetical protein